MTRSGRRSSDATRPLRVMYFVPATKHFAGIERVVHEIATGLAVGFDDLEVHVVYAGHLGEQLLTQTKYQKHQIHASRLRHLPFAVRGVLRRVRPDVVVTPQVEATTILWFASRGLRIRSFVAHLHGNPMIERRDGSLTTRLAFHAFTAVVAHRLAAVIAVSPSLATSAHRWLDVSTPVVFVPNPVRTIEAGRAERPPGEPFRFLCVGRLSKQKGQDLLISAVALAAPRLPEVRLVLVGNGSEETALRALATHLGVESIVEFAGYEHDPARAYAAADCFVLASRWEGFGVVLIEALQGGLPIVATDCDFGPGDIVVDPRIGELVPPEDVTALADALVRAAARRDAPEAADYRRRSAEPYLSQSAVRSHHRVLTGLPRIARAVGGPVDVPRVR